MLLKDVLLTESIHDQSKFKAVFLAGLPASGKSTLIRAISDGRLGVRMVDIDKFVEFYGDKLGIDVGDPEATEKLFRETNINQKRVSELVAFVNGMLPMFIDGTAADFNQILKRDDILHSLGYDTAMIWIGSDLETVIDNQKYRKRQVPEWAIRQYDYLLDGHFEAYQKYFGDNFYYHHNVFFTDDDMNELFTLLTAQKLNDTNAEEENRIDFLKNKMEKAAESLMSLPELEDKADAFFNSPLRNAKGRAIIDKLESIGGHYLSDLGYTAEGLERQLSGF